MNDILNLEISLFKEKNSDHLDLFDKQIQGLDILHNQETTELAYGGGAGGGKTWFGCTWLAFMALSYPGTRYFIGRQELKRLLSTTFLTFTKVCKHFQIPSTLWKYNGQYNYIQFSNGSRIDFLELKYLPSDPLYERFGSEEFTAGMIEEGGEVNFEAVDTLRARIGRQYNEYYGIKKKILITCNPKKNWLYQYFYRPWKEGKLEPYQQFLPSLATDNPRIDNDYIEGLHNIKDKAKKERLLYGNWEYEDDPAALMDYDCITDIFTNSQVESGKRYITADIARLGGDSTVIRVWSGWRVLERLEIEKNKITEAAEKIKELKNKHKVPTSHIIADEDGVGGGLVDILNCKGFVANSKPFNKENYDNLKSQCLFHFAEKVQEGEVYDPVENEQLKQRIIEELEQVKQKEVDTDRKKGVVPKDKVKDIIGRSPDDLDCLMMRAYFDLKKEFQVLL